MIQNAFPFSKWSFEFNTRRKMMARGVQAFSIVPTFGVMMLLASIMKAMRKRYYFFQTSLGFVRFLDRLEPSLSWCFVYTSIWFMRGENSPPNYKRLYCFKYSGPYSRLYRAKTSKIRSIYCSFSFTEGLYFKL